MEQPDAKLALGVIETDAFCDRCGFNLHSQKVWRDGQLGILVCRCPECGAHQTAGVRTAVTSPWLNRLALVGLLIWVALALSFIVGTFFMHFGIQIGSTESLITNTYETRDGKPVQLSYNGTSASNPGPMWVLTADAQAVVPQSEVVRRSKLVRALTGAPMPPPPVYYGEIPLVAVVILGTVFTAGTFITACIASAASWFWRPAWRGIWLLLPPLACLLFYTMERSTQTTYPPYNGVELVGRGLFHGVLFAVTAGQVLVTGLGLLFGRGIARFVLTVLVPPGARQLFAFLWHCDGKAMPPPAPRL